MAHLDREDRELYPALKALEQSNAIANAFQTEMAGITVQALEIFQRYEKGVDDKTRFARDTGQLFALVSGRIIKEEMRLYPAYEENAGKNSR
ncbi:MAG: hypothetical protein HS115_17295 [Spirochaetales bacterium]|nr:hypothetical protein [Spirochaetales bacterium]